MTTPPRVRVTSPRTGAAKVRRVAPNVEIDRRTRLGQVYLSSLVRTQLLLAAGVLLVGVGTLVSLPLLLRLDAVAEREVLGMPLPWVVLGFAVHPFLLACGWFYVRRAERNEEAFADLVEPLVTDGPPATEERTP
ncbi:hypothetical protein G7072_15935 [Nocardioides sp. HDW12B]|uniref:hypothetical protein n=1 Tax=Nocardioides sp. HDW12B TaxID=2714939 RepID=UPI001408A172|nr:hypothetical protein [Nocardioides sp. HDW12B]QIK67641.1 hypothetical protein G7072_15935 [Nocardioides sp. HDW12B]